MFRKHFISLMRKPSLKCCVAAHWGCLARSQHDEIIKAAREKDKESEAAGLKPLKRETLEAYDTTEFICGACMKDGICMYCHQVAVTSEPPTQKKAGGEEKEQGQEKLSTQKILHVSAKEVPVTDMQSRKTPPTIVVDLASLTKDAAGSSGPSPFIDPTPQEPSNNSSSRSSDALELLFRCKTCKRLAHYTHLPQPEPGANLTPAELAQYYQTENGWECSDCISYVHTLDTILAWRPYPADAVEPHAQSGYIPNPKMRLPREYLVKWLGKSYRRLQWVPHMWLAASYSTKLKNFLTSGPKIQLLDAPEEAKGGQAQGSLTMTKPEKEPDPSFLIAMDNSRDPSAQPASEEEQGPSPALPDAERRIPLAWCTIDRLLDVRLWDPAGPKRTHREKKAKTRQSRRPARRKRLDSDDEDDTEMDDEDDPRAEAELAAARELGEEPSQEYLETVDQWEQRTGDSFGIEHTELVIWGFIKWADLAYEEGGFIPVGKLGGGN
jgi:chromodomain-helicase-DNA-binding protein 4